MRWFAVILVLFLISDYVIAMEVATSDLEAGIASIQMITSLKEAKRVASLDSSQHKNYTLSPGIIAYAIKRDMLRQVEDNRKEKTKVSKEEIEIVEADLKTNYEQLHAAAYILLQPSKGKNLSTDDALREVQGKLFHYEQRVVDHLQNELKKNQGQVERYKLYKPHEAPICWGMCFLVKLVILGAIVVRTLDICEGR